MREIKQLAQGLEPSITSRDIQLFVNETGNIYHTLVIIAKRSTQISKQLKEELHAKLEEFASTTETLEEIHENKEQIEISKFYERLPNPVIIAMNEYLLGNIHVGERKEEEEPRRGYKKY